MASSHRATWTASTRHSIRSAATSTTNAQRTTILQRHTQGSETVGKRRSSTSAKRLASLSPATSTRTSAPAAAAAPPPHARWDPLPPPTPAASSDDLMSEFWTDLQAKQRDSALASSSASPPLPLGSAPQRPQTLEEDDAFLSMFASSLSAWETEELASASDAATAAELAIPSEDLAELLLLSSAPPSIPSPPLVASQLPPRPSRSNDVEYSPVHGPKEGDADAADSAIEAEQLAAQQGGVAELSAPAQAESVTQLDPDKAAAPSDSTNAARRTRRRAASTGTPSSSSHRFGLDILPPALVRPLDTVRIDGGLPRLERVPVREAADKVSPFRPYPLPTATSPSPSTRSARVDPLPQSHHLPLASRTDWRLSSPARFKLHPKHPLPLWNEKETSTRAMGSNRLVGIGPGTARVGRMPRGLKQGEEREGWGWKAKVPEGERGAWKDADRYVERYQRLLDLSKASDEQLYLASLSRAGPPLERQQKGLTVSRATGTWLTDTSRVADWAAMSAEVRDAERKKRDKAGGGGSAGGGKTAVAEFRTEGGYEVTKEEGFKFESGMVLRISEAGPVVREHDAGPQAPPAAKLEAKWHVQGTLLEVRKDKLVVAFDELDMWPLTEDDAYQIDIGLDLASYALQTEALNKLYYDPARQRERNAIETLAVQEGHVLDAGKAHVREWTLQGTELRQDLVPATDTAADSANDIESDLFRDNQLINSWIERYRRDEPLVLPGDPDLGLNASQTKAIAMALGDRLSLIQGPPGTGKSQTIVSLIALLKLHFRVPHPILLAAPTHVSVDHLVSLLVRAGLNPLRCGKAHRVSPEIRNWTIEKRQEEHPMWRPTEAARLASEEARQALQEFREEMRSLNQTSTPAAIKKDAELMETFRKTWRTFIMREQKLYSSLLATADVFCATAVGSGASKVLNMIDFPIVLLDEAAMCTEPVSLIPLMKGAQHATLIGDHKQLPAVVTSKEARTERLHTSLFERLLQSGTVDSTLLDTQYRMRPAISSFPNASFYHGALKDASIVTDRPAPLKSRYFSSPKSPVSHAAPSASSAAPPGARTESTLADAAAAFNSEPFPVSFVAHTSPESSYRQSLLNRGESDLLIKIVGDLLASNPDLQASEIGIISPYYAQTRLVSNSFTSGFASARLGDLLHPDRAASAVDVEVNTVDGFQGREKRVILLSTARSNSGGWIGFLNDKRRLNVALTRARDALIVVGNQETLRRAASRPLPLLSRSRQTVDGDNAFADSDPDADPRIWAEFLDWCQRHGAVKTAEQDSA